MPTDRLTSTPTIGPVEPDRTTHAVLRVLAGDTIAAVAAGAELEPVMLGDAVDVFRHAGIQALADAGTAPTCRQLYLHFSDWMTAETTAARHLFPHLHQAEKDGSVTRWWFIRKHPCWRLRVHIPPGTGTPHGIGDALDEMTTAGDLVRWWPGTYEPETAAFGGGAAMDIAHRLFHTDSHAILDLAAHGNAPLGRPELSVLLLTTLLRAAGLEWYEQGDVWDRACRERPLPDDITSGQTARMGEDLRHILLADTTAAGTLFSPGSQLASTATWADDFRNAGRNLGKRALAGTLERGLRQVLSYHVIFHWNRLGIASRMQAALAHSARDAILGAPARADQACLPASGSYLAERSEERMKR